MIKVLLHLLCILAVGLFCFDFGVNYGIVSMADRLGKPLLECVHLLGGNLKKQ